MSSCWRRWRNCGWALLLLVVQLDGERDHSSPYSHQEDLKLVAGFSLLLPPHSVVGEHRPVDNTGCLTILTTHFLSTNFRPSCTL